VIAAIAANVTNAETELEDFHWPGKAAFEENRHVDFCSRLKVNFSMLLKNVRLFWIC